MEGDSIAEISRKLEVSRDAVYKYLAMEDLSPRPPAPCAKASVFDRYRPLIESCFDMQVGSASGSCASYSLKRG